MIQSNKRKLKGEEQIKLCEAGRTRYPSADTKFHCLNENYCYIAKVMITLQDLYNVLFFLFYEYFEERNQNTHTYYTSCLMFIFYQFECRFNYVEQLNQCENPLFYLIQ